MAAGYRQGLGKLGGSKSSEESWVKCMAHENGVTKLVGFLTIAACIAALVDPRFRKLCLGLLCKL
jgi:hypothetical protein